MVCEVTVEKSLFNISNHWPVIQSMSDTWGKGREKLPQIKVWNCKGIDGHGWTLALSNQWNALPVEDMDSKSQLNEMAKWWVDTLNAVGEEVHLLSIPPVKRKFEFDRQTIEKDVLMRHYSTGCYLTLL